MSRIDVNILKQIGNDVGMDMYDSLIEIFISDSSERLESLKSQFENNDLAKLKITAHTLKSVCAQYGAMGCSAIAKDLEKMCVDHPSDNETIGKTVAQLSNELNEAMKEIKEIKI